MRLRCIGTVFGLLFLTGLCFGVNHPIVLYDLRDVSGIDCGDIKQVNHTWDLCHVVSTLQGIVNREEPRLYVRFVDSQHKDINIDDYWLEKYSGKDQWLQGATVTEVDSLEQLVRHFDKFINGLVVYDPKVCATSNVASAVAGAEGLIAVRFDKSADSVYMKLVQKLKLPVKVWLVNPDGSSKFNKDGLIPGTQRYTTGSAKCDAYIWMKELYLDTGKLNPEFGAYYIDYYWATNPARIPINHHNLSNHDFFVSQRGWFFDLDPWADEAATDDPEQVPGTDRRTMQELLLSAYKQVNGKKMIHIGGFPPWAHKYTQSAGYRHPDVATEWEYCAVISAYNAYKDADAISYGAMANSSFWQHFPLDENYPQKWVTHEELKDRGYLTDDGKVKFDGRQFLIFYVGDYDAASWLYQRVPDLWDDPNRGKIPLMWCFSPIIGIRAPMVMHYVRSSATENDYFASADNGAGYLNPGMLQHSTHIKSSRPISGLPSGISVWQKHCQEYYTKWGLTITGFVIDGYAKGMGPDELSCYEAFSPNGLVWQKGSLSYLYHDMPVLRSDADINDDPLRAAQRAVDRVNRRPIPFHWFRNILKSPSWYVEVNENIKKINPKIELIDAPTFFELYRIYLENHPDAAHGKYNYL